MIRSVIIKSYKSVVIAATLFCVCTSALYAANNATTQGTQSDIIAPVKAKTALDWLTKLSVQVKQLNFEVSFVVTGQDKETQPYLWRHAVLGDGTHIEQLSLLNGPGFEQIRYNSVVSVFEPGYPPYSTAADAIDGPIPWMLMHQPQSLSESYEFVLVGRNRISGRAAQQIRIISRDKTRFNYHVWLDEDSGMLLKLNMYDLNANLIEQIQVTQLLINESVAQAFASLQLSNLPKVIAMKEPPQREHKWQVSFLPVGMKKIKQDIHRLAITGQIVEYTLLSDGLVDVSVYIQQASEVITEDMQLRNDTNTVFSRTNGRVQVTVIGEIPPITADRIASSIVLLDS